jgi:hypothetical protein
MILGEASVHLADLRPNVPAASTIAIGTGATFATALELVVSGDMAAREVLVLPSSLRRADRIAAALREQLRAYGVASHLVLPVNPLAALAHLGRGKRIAHWCTVNITLPDKPPGTVCLPAQMIGENPVWTVTDVDAVSGRGPFVLDLIARYVHPILRVQLLASSSRADDAVDVNLVVRISVSVIGKMVGSFAMVGVTSDPIAAELFAMALADEDLAVNRAVVGPWEDRVIQRATELELGVRIPQDLSISLAGEISQPAREAVERIVRRFGVGLS